MCTKKIDYSERALTELQIIVSGVSLKLSPMLTQVNIFRTQCFRLGIVSQLWRMSHRKLNKTP